MIYQYHLGILTTSKHQMVIHHIRRYLIKKIRRRICSWIFHHFSSVGRFQLTISVISSLANFWMSAFMLPKQCIKEIYHLCSAFLWSGFELNLRKAKIALKDVFKPKEEGWLGLISLTEVNTVCCLQLKWQIIYDGSTLWSDGCNGIWSGYMHLIWKGSFRSINDKSEDASKVCRC